MSFLNGRVPAALLVTVEDNDRLFAPAANSFLTMRAAAARDGVSITVAEPAGAYRSYEVQVDMTERPWLYNLNPNSSIKVSPPGYSSHGFGTRFDAGSGNAWLLRNASRYGWSREFGAKDPNHWMHDGRTATAGTATAHQIPQRRNITMRTIRVVDDPANKFDDPAWPAGKYIATDNGIDFPTPSSLPFSVVNRIAGDEATFEGVQMYGAEARDTDAILRKIAAKNSTGSSTVVNITPDTILARFRLFWTSGK